MELVFRNWGNGSESWESEEDARDNFIFYFHYHYKPLLDKLADNPYQKIELSEKDKRLLGFLRDDMNKIFETAYNSL